MEALDAKFVKDAARAAGFHHVGVARAQPLDPGPLDRFLGMNAEAGMVWLKTRREERLDPGRLLPGAKSVIAVALAYGSNATEGAAPNDCGEVARYARGRDYHAVMKRRLASLVGAITVREPAARCFASSDIAPVMEKAWAERAGLGWIGKNGCLITERHGSWVVLGTVLVDRELEPDPPHPERCGTCDACQRLCPTAAIPLPGLVDSRRCISYWTIERRGEIPAEMALKLGRWVFGCDECQLVCPWNRKPDVEGDRELAQRPGQAALNLDSVLGMDEATYRARFYGTAIARARYDGLLRNAILLAGASSDRERVEVIRTHLDSPYEGVRAAALWALERLK